MKLTLDLNPAQLNSLARVCIAEATGDAYDDVAGDARDALIERVLFAAARQGHRSPSVNQAITLALERFSRACKLRARLPRARRTV